MKTTTLLFLLLLTAAGTLFGQSFNEILGRPTDNSITVNVLFDSQVEAYFEYGTIQGNYPNSTVVTTSVLNEPVEVKITALLANTRYYYRTRYRKVGTIPFLASEMHTFMTQRKKGSRFVFTMEADPHPYDPKGYHPLWEIALQNQLNDGADFMIDLGDTFGDDHYPTTITSSQVQQLMMNNRPIFGKVCHSMPFFFCQGNHEGESGYYLLQTPPNNLATYETLWRKFYYPNPFPDGFYTGNNESENFGMDKPENYYAWEWGDALFVVVDGWRYYTANAKPRNWEWTIGKTQYDWLKQTLETSTAKYKFVFTHHVMGETRGGIGVAPTFEWGGLDNTKNLFATNRPGWAMPIHQLMVKNKVNVLFQGHDHVYARESLDSLVYQTVPMPSDSSYSLGYIANGAAFKGTVLDGSGHIRVTVDPDSVKVDYVSARLAKDEGKLKNGIVVYSYTIKNKIASALEPITANLRASDWSVYPNPAKEVLHFNFNQTIVQKTNARIYSVDGRFIKQYNWEDGISDKQLKTIQLIDDNGQKLNAGMYIISIVVDNIPISQKLFMIQ